MGTGARWEGQTKIEFDSDGTFGGSSLKINGEPIMDCMAFSFAVKPVGLVEVTITFEAAEVVLTGDLTLEETVTASSDG